MSYPTRPSHPGGWTVTDAFGHVAAGRPRGPRSPLRPQRRMSHSLRMTLHMRSDLLREAAVPGLEPTAFPWWRAAVRDGHAAALVWLHSTPVVEILPDGWLLHDGWSDHTTYPTPTTLRVWEEFSPLRERLQVSIIGGRRRRVHQFTPRLATGELIHGRRPRGWRLRGILGDEPPRRRKCRTCSGTGVHTWAGRCHRCDGTGTADYGSKPIPVDLPSINIWLPADGGVEIVNTRPTPLEGMDYPWMWASDPCNCRSCSGEGWYAR